MAKERLIVALDVNTLADALKWVKLLKDDVGVFKVGLELFVTQGPEIIKKMRAAGARAIFLDIKLHDIPATMRAAARQAVALGVDFLTCHCEQIDIFTDMDLSDTRLLGITVLTSLEQTDLVRQGYDAPFTDPFKLAMLRAQIALGAGCHGVVCSGHEAAGMREVLGSDALIVCPGIRPGGSEVNDQKRVVTPRQAIEAGASHIVVGRPILKAVAPLSAARAIVADMA